jgi:hypothetical protein
VAKRIYKPTIPSTRKQGGDSIGSSQVDTDSKRGRDTKSPRGRGARSQRGGKERTVAKTIQLDGFFTGIDAVANPSTRDNHAPAASSSREAVSRVSGPCSANGPVSASKTQARTEVNQASLDNLFRDDFIDDSSSDEETGTQVRPKGFENLTNETSIKFEKKSAVAEVLTGIPIDKWLEADDKLFLLQVPDILVKRPKGLIGKLRIYKSGRFELVDSETGVSFELLRANANPSTLTIPVKSEGKSRSTNFTASNPSDINQEIVHLSTDSLTALSRVHSEDILVAVPQISTDS